jgi:hypothetical protein
MNCNSDTNVECCPAPGQKLEGKEAGSWKECRSWKDKTTATTTKETNTERPRPHNVIDKRDGMQ